MSRGCQYLSAPVSACQVPVRGNCDRHLAESRALVTGLFFSSLHSDGEVVTVGLLGTTIFGHVCVACWSLLGSPGLQPMSLVSSSLLGKVAQGSPTVVARFAQSLHKVRPIVPCRLSPGADDFLCMQFAVLFLAHNSRPLFGLGFCPKGFLLLV